MGQFGKTNGELMLEAMEREARIDIWYFRLKLLLILLAIGAATKYLFF